MSISTVRQWRHATEDIRKLALFTDANYPEGGGRLASAGDGESHLSLTLVTSYILMFVVDHRKVLLKPLYHLVRVNSLATLFLTLLFFHSNLYKWRID